VRRILKIAIGLGVSVTAVAAGIAQQPAASSSGSATAKPWVAPGTPGSPIDGKVFHAQVLLDLAGFPTGVIDGKEGMVFKKAVQGFQQARGLDISGRLDNATRAALLQANRPSTAMVTLSADDVAGPFVYPFPKKPEAQAKLKEMGYRNMLEKVAERFHTTPDTIVALNGPTKLIGAGRTLRLPNVVPANRDYSGTVGDKQAGLLAMFNIDGAQPTGDFVVVDKSEGVLKVYKGTPPKGAFSSEKNRGAPPKLADDAGELIAQFPVTMGSDKDPLPLGKWKATTYAFLPPFHYQPELFWDVDDSKEEQKLPPGPNGPVGVAWLDLTKEHYGIHGTPSPETIGRAESHGCVRLANWDVIRLSRMMKPGFTAIFQA
jgi:hypothetical protein